MLPRISIDGESRHENFNDQSAFDESCIELPISARAMVVLSRAAKRTVQKQQQILVRENAKNYRFLKSSIDCRRKLKTPVAGIRTEVYSAPPQLRQATNLIPVSIKETPKIVIISASQDGSNFESEEPKKSEIVFGNHSYVNHTTAPLLTKWGREDSPDGTDTSNIPHELSVNLEDITPESQSRDDDKIPRTTRSFTDWSWVRDKLCSRESVLTCADSALTFDDFMEATDQESDEYDTDLEEDFIACNIEDSDPTGLWCYERICKSRGIAPTQQVVQKLANQDQNFKLNHRCFNSGDSFALANGLAHNSFVKNLNLSGNCIKEEGAQYLANMLKKNNTISTLDLSDNYLQSGAGCYIADMLCENTSLTHICISNNKLGDKEACLLSEGLRCNIYLRSLDTSHNCFTDIAGTAIARALIDNDVMDSLNLAWNMLGKQSAAALGKALKVNSSLKNLDLSWNGLGDEGAALLSRPLSSNTSLKHLSLAVNHIGPFGIESLATGICGIKGKTRKKSNCGLRSLSLDRNPLGRKGVTVLVKHMEQSEVLIDLSIREVVLTTELLCMIRRLLSSRSVSLFYEGQREEEKHICAIQYGAIFLRQILNQNQLQLQNFFDVLDPNNKGIAFDRLEDALRNLKRSPSELELKRLLLCLNSRRTGLIQLQDVSKYSYVPASAITHVKTKKLRIKKRRGVPKS